MKYYMLGWQNSASLNPSSTGAMRQKLGIIFENFKIYFYYDLAENKIFVGNIVKISVKSFQLYPAIK